MLKYSMLEQSEKDQYHVYVNKNDPRHQRWINKAEQKMGTTRRDGGILTIAFRPARVVVNGYIYLHYEYKLLHNKKQARIFIASLLVKYRCDEVDGATFPLWVSEFKPTPEYIKAHMSWFERFLYG